LSTFPDALQQERNPATTSQLEANRKPNCKEWVKAMSEEGTLDFIPEDLSDEAKETLKALSAESEPEPAPLVVNEYLIHHWCETLEDGNPLYLDEEYAKSRGYRSVLAPPGSFMTTFAMPIRWPWPPGGREPARHIHFDIKEALDLPVGIIGSIEVDMGVPLQVGDQVSVSQRLVDISPWKKTRLGEGHFWTMDRLYRNQNGELVARERMSAFGYGREEGSKQAAIPDSGGGWSPAVEEVLDGKRTGYKPPPLQKRHWEDVEEGEELPELIMPINLRQHALQHGHGRPLHDGLGRPREHGAQGVGQDAAERVRRRRHDHHGQGDPEVRGGRRPPRRPGHHDLYAGRARDPVRRHALPAQPRQLTKPRPLLQQQTPGAARGVLRLAFARASRELLPGLTPHRHGIRFTSKRVPRAGLMGEPVMKKGCK
jgi:hypothetical protein